ncbi:MULTISPECIES: helix-turn-helix domain-containing protein [Bacteria]|uniref:helix-turn-helix domain-containing protein n=1 Tax=Bacteria TaxID=2 RepID=UPI003C7D416B
MREMLRESRERAGLSQSQLALRSGVAQPNIAAYESGRRDPSDAMVTRLLSAMRPLPHEALERHRDALKELAAEYGLSNVRVFGSAGRGTDTAQSDLDLLVTRAPNVGLLTIAEFTSAAEQLLGVPVDVVTDGGLPSDHPISGGCVRDKDERSLREIVRLCDDGVRLAHRGHDWYVSDELNTPGLAAESIIIKIGENVARLSDEMIVANPQVPWSSIKRMRDRHAHHYEATDYDAVWATLEIDLPRVLAAISSILTEAPTENAHERVSES